MKKILLATVILFNAFSGNSQNSFRVQGGIDLGIPVHNLGGTSVGLGVDLTGIYRLSDAAALTGDFGYTALLAKSRKDATTNLLPLRIGLRYYPTGNFFVGGKIGAGFISNPGTTSITTTTYSFGLGLNASQRVEIGGSYDGYSKYGSVGLINFRLGYRLN
jgi:hypothetical protein